MKPVEVKREIIRFGDGQVEQMEDHMRIYRGYGRWFSCFRRSDSKR